MELLEKIDLFCELTDELVVQAESNSEMPSSGYPHKTIREVARNILISLNERPDALVNGQLHNYFTDFINERFSDKNLDYHWDNYLASLMDQVSMTKKAAPTKELGDFYQGLFDQLSKLWDDISNTNGWATHVTKPIVLPWVGNGDKAIQARLEQIYALIKH